MCAVKTALRGRVVLPDSVVEDGLVVLDGDRITYAGPVAGALAGAPAGLEVPPERAGTLLPGLVDLHNHGGGGVGFPAATSADEVRVALHEHLRAGTTTQLASLVTADRATLLGQAALLADLADAGELGGIHAEGPFLSYACRGAQSPDHLIPGDPGLVRELAAAARGHLRTMTVAPEIPGVTEAGGATEALLAAGVLPSIGHTSASFEVAEAFLAGVRQGLSGRPTTATHLFNGMPPLHHRAPGPVAACLAAARDGALVAELVADGVHLAPGTVRTMFDLLGPDGIALVTDAMAAAGMPDGRYELGPMSVRVADGVARLASAGDPDDPDNDGGGSIAGGTAHLVEVVQCTVAAGVPLVDAVRSASWVPAAVLGLSDVGGLVAGRRADVVVADEHLRVTAVYRAGALVA